MDLPEIFHDKDEWAFPVRWSAERLSHSIGMRTGVGSCQAYVSMKLPFWVSLVPEEVSANPLGFPFFLSCFFLPGNLALFSRATIRSSDAEYRLTMSLIQINPIPFHSREHNPLMGIFVNNFSFFRLGQKRCQMVDRSPG
ncbi:MAG: hypothetical protein MZW92_71960 [Comamonadaceae bacterium]|nr:hypothetical protein [Comamonadaceae bacterium]